MASITVVFHSGYGHTEALAHCIAEGVTKGGGTATLIKAADLPDPDPQSGYSDAWDALNNADAIVFGTPTYMGNVSAGLKRFMEASSGIWAKQGWKDKIAGGFTVGGGLTGDKDNTIDGLLHFAAQHSMLWISTGIAREGELNRLGAYVGMQAQADNAPADQTPPEGDRETARLYGARIAELTAKFTG